MALVERERPLAALREAAQSALRGPGRLALLSGEAGAGKTSLVSALLDALPAGTRVLHGACDDLGTPRPLAPLHDWAVDEPPLRTALREGDRSAVFGAALEALGRGPCVAVLEDVHWSDDATLDVVAVLVRRLARTRALLVLTHRPDGAAPASPLAATLGALASARPLRVPLLPLSREAVAQLARAAGGVLTEGGLEALHARTGGNAFFVAECLAAPDAALPATVRDVVLARTARLDAEGRQAAACVAVSPGSTPLWLALAVGASSRGVDLCVRHGVLVPVEQGVRFRHELARLAVLDGLPPGERRALHARALDALGDPPRGELDHARLTHHAVGCDDAAAVRRHAPQAAALAEAAGSRRQAVAHLELALDHAAPLPAAQRLDLWSRLAEQRAALGRHAAAVAAYARAQALAAELGDDETGGLLRARAWAPLSMSGDLAGAERAVREALAVLEPRPPGPALALALAQRCAHHMLARELPEAEPWARRATELARGLGDDETLAYALVQGGVARWMAGHEDGLARLRDGIGLARRRGAVALVAQGLSQIGSGGGEVRRYAEAVPALEECLAVAERHELGSRGRYARAWLARCHLDLGRWDAAAAGLSAVLTAALDEGITRLTALTDLGRLRARRGDPDPWTPLDEALALARATGHLQRLWPVLAARAEAAEAAGRLAAHRDELAEGLALAARVRHPWAVGELAVWLTRSGERGVLAEDAAEPWALLLAGLHREAAAAWGQLGCPYERAVALAACEDDAAQREALAELQALGAQPALDRLVAARRAAGRPVPRGPNAATRGTPAGLTGRELEVLRLVAAGCSNPEIGRRLQLSAKTVGHHVSHLLAKLGARTRAEAVAAALRAGVPVHDHAPQPWHGSIARCAAGAPRRTVRGSARTPHAGGTTCPATWSNARSPAPAASPPTSSARSPPRATASWPAWAAAPSGCRASSATTPSRASTSPRAPRPCASTPPRAASPSPASGRSAPCSTRRRVSPRRPDRRGRPRRRHLGADGVGAAHPAGREAAHRGLRRRQPPQVVAPLHQAAGGRVVARGAQDDQARQEGRDCRRAGSPPAPDPCAHGPSPREHRSLWRSQGGLAGVSGPPPGATG